MNLESRRRFLIQSCRLGAAALVPAWLPRRAPADPLGRPVGIQLYTVNAPMREDAAGTLKKLREIGYGEVETAGFGKLSSRDFRKLLDDAGLTCRSAHLQFDMGSLGPTFEDAHALGAKYAASGSLRAQAIGAVPAPTMSTPPLTLDEAKRTAELANRIGEAAKRAGVQYCYHNHHFEFADLGSEGTGYDLLLRETDPDLVKFEIDCGWMVFAGRNPVEYFKKHPKRFPLIHVKDFLPPQDKGWAAGGQAPMMGAELGHGVIDYKPIFAAGKKAGLQHYFVEQEGPFARMDEMRAVKVDYDYLHALI